MFYNPNQLHLVPNKNIFGFLLLFSSHMDNLDLYDMIYYFLKPKYLLDLVINIYLFPDLLPRINSWGSLVGYYPTRVAKPTTPTH